MNRTTPWPTVIRLSRTSGRSPSPSDDGPCSPSPRKLLRVESPSAEVQGHARVAAQDRARKRDVAILAVQPVGSYAVRLRFDDMHDTGIFTWPYLRELGETGLPNWRPTRRPWPSAA